VIRVFTRGKPPAPGRRRRNDPAADRRQPTSPLLRAGAAARRPLLPRWGVAAAVLLAPALAATMVWQRWFDPHGYFRPVYVFHDAVVLPVIGAMWTAWFPWGLLYLVPGAVMLGLTLAGLVSGRRPLGRLQRRVILAVAGRAFGHDILCRAHRLQCEHGPPGDFMRAVIANAAGAAVDAVLLAPPGLHGAEERDRLLRHAWRLVEMRCEMTADARPGQDAAYAAAAQVALLWLVAPPSGERTQSRLPAPWQTPDEALSRGRAPDQLARRLRRELGAIEAGILEIERRDGRFSPDAATPAARSPEESPPRSSERTSWERTSSERTSSERTSSERTSSERSWAYYAEQIFTATFLAGIAPQHAGLAMSVIDAVERTAIADLVSARPGAGAAATAVAQAIDITDARRAASLIGAKIDRAAAGDLASWRGPALGEPELDRSGLAPALRGLAEAAVDPRADVDPADLAEER
jgi:hypothetical protein